jgi:hypothetical protein
MERDLAGATLTADDFGRLSLACSHDPKFPQSFDEWKEMVDIGHQALAAQGTEAPSISLEVDDFVAWCQRVDVAPCLDALRAYLILVRRSEHVPGESPTGPRRRRRASQPPTDTARGARRIDVRLGAR